MCPRLFVQHKNRLPLGLTLVQLHRLLDGEYMPCFIHQVQFNTCIMMQLCCRAQFFLKCVIFLGKKNKNADSSNQKRTFSILFSANFSSSWTIFSRVLGEEKIFLRFCHFVRFWKINLQNTSGPLKVERKLANTSKYP